MATVTQVAKVAEQPYGGFVKTALFDRQSLRQADTAPLHAMTEENVEPALIGTVVDYLTRYAVTGDWDRAFLISRIGSLQSPEADRLIFDTWFNEMKTHDTIDDDVVLYAVNCVRFDSVYRAGLLVDDPSTLITPNTATTENIKQMVERAVAFFDRYGDVTAAGFNFAPNGYTDIIHAGDGDFLTEDTLWDFKVSKYDTLTKSTKLQLLIYFIMGKHSGNPLFKSLTHVGVFNPRTNTVSRLKVADIDPWIIQHVTLNVIGYDS